MIELRRGASEQELVYLMDEKVQVKKQDRGRAWVLKDSVKCSEGVTVATVKPVSFFDAQKAEAAGIESGEAAQILTLIKCGLVSIDNAGCTIDELLSDPSPAPIMGLYNYIHRLTWGK